MKTRLPLLLILLISLIITFDAPLVHAGTIINVADGAVAIVNDDICSLLEAVDNAQNIWNGNQHDDCAAGDPMGEDVIRLAINGNYLFDVDSAEFYITGDVSINGRGATLDHTDDGFFRLAGGSHLKLRNITVTGSNGTLAAIDVTGSLTLRNCTFRENVHSGSGGAINMGVGSFGNKLDIDDCVFEDNVSSGTGGAIELRTYAAATADAITITNSRFEGNGAWSGAPGTTTVRGGAIYISAYDSISSNQFTIDNSKFLGNYASEDGGAIYVDSAFGTISNSGIDNNDADRNGGGLSVSDRAEVRVEYSVVSNNNALSYAGGIHNISAVLTLYNSTVSGNSGARTGGIFNGGFTDDTEISSVNIDFSTIANNKSTGTGTYSGGVNNNDNAAVVGNTISIQNSIVYGNTSNGSGQVDCDKSGGSIVSLGYNVWDNSPIGGCPLTPSTDVTAIGAVTDHLMGLADNDGPTRTHAIPAGSIALNQIPMGESGCTADVLDQRGYFRASGNGVKCDVGAYEYGAYILPTPPTAVEMVGVSAETTNPQNIILILLTVILSTLSLMQFNLRFLWDGFGRTQPEAAAKSGEEYR